MPRCVDQVQIEFFPFFVDIGKGNGVALDGDAPFPFDVHGIQYLVAEPPLIHQTGVLNQTVGQGGLTVIDMGDNTENFESVS